MGDHEDFLEWLSETRYEANVSLFSGDGAPRREMWSRREPVSVFGAWAVHRAVGQPALDDLLRRLGGFMFEPGCLGYADELVSSEVVGDLAYTVGLEYVTQYTPDGTAQGQYTLRVTQVFRREDGEWRLVHRHADRELSQDD